MTHDSEAGQLSLFVLIFASISILVLSGFIIWADANLKAVFRSFDSAQGFMISEAGVEYYRWHLAHAQSDYKDGTNTAGPYVHQFKDKDGTNIGSFSLAISAPAVGSTVVTINSTGSTVANPGLTKLIEARMGIPSFAKYAAVIGSDVRFGAGTELFGPVHSNNGVRMDGLAHNLVTSSVASYDDPDHTGGSEFGVHTHIAPTDPLPPAAVPSRPDVFMAGRQFPVAPADFIGLTQDLAQMKTDAQAAGLYRGPSGVQGYLIIFKVNHTYDLYKVNTLVAAPSGCTNSQNQTGWGTWSVNTKTLQGNFAMPTNGLIFIEDNVWVEGKIDSTTARVTVASGKFPDNSATRTSITVNNDLTYTNYDGTNVIALVAQNNINIGMVSDTDIRIDAALMAQNGRVGRYYYDAPGGGSNRCSPYHGRNSITSFGMIASNQRYGFAYTDGTGYVTRTIIYDANLLYAPPPSFPLTADYYTPILWNEKK